MIFLYLPFFLEPIFSGFAAFESAVAETFGLTCFGFFASLLPRLLSFLDIRFPFQNATGLLKKLLSFFAAGFHLRRIVASVMNIKGGRQFTGQHLQRGIQFSYY